MTTTIEELPLSIRTPQAAKLLGVSEQTYRALCRSGQIPARHIGRAWVISREKLLSYLNGDDVHAAA